MSSFNPNDIIGFSYFDAHTAHGVKLLDPIMYAKQNISYILDGTNTVKGVLKLHYNDINMILEIYMKVIMVGEFLHHIFVTMILIRL